VVEDHVETTDGRGHEEVYVVLAGHATFTLDGEHLDAPAGTFVAVASSRRRCRG
jgi:mannose-6-phosphate isomerase-like protein (cupin superfamily)